MTTTASRGSELLDGALALARRRLPVIRLRPRSKIPVHRNWPALGTTDPETIRTEWPPGSDCNVGVVCGDGLVVVDVDMPDGPEVLRVLELEHGNLPATATVRTPSGGRHFYFTGDAISWDPAPGLEVRSTGRQCAAPPSKLASGVYRWVADREFAKLPVWLAGPGAIATVTGRDPGRGEFVSRVEDPVLEVDPPTYFRVLAGLVPNRAGFVSCPVHPHPDTEPSCKVYRTAKRGWCCYGRGCGKGGDVIALAAGLAGIATPVRGYQFEVLLDYLRGRLL